MDIFLRNIDPSAMQKINELVKEHKMFRQRFLKEQFGLLGFFKRVNSMRKKARRCHRSEL